VTTQTAWIIEGLQPLAVSIDTVRPMNGNPRKGDVEAVKRSLARFGQRKPIVATSDGTITAGHHLHAAAVALGWTEIAVVFTDDDDATAKAFALADNRTSDLGRYDHEALAAMLSEVRDADAALLEAASYTEQDLDDLLAYIGGQARSVDPDDPEPEPREATSGLTCPRCGYQL
jgi:ParB-like chromosome segregation protein Spo0J